MEFIDTHTHNSDEAYKGHEDEVIARALAAGVTKMLQADTSSKERDAMYALARRHPGVLYPMLGLYPGDVDASWRDEIDKVLSFNAPDAVAIGEIGLDYHFSTEFKQQQKEALRIQLEMAAKRNLPVNIHLRDATGDFMEIIRDCAHLGLRGNLHAFSGSAETFRQLRGLGDWYVGIGGVLTFKKASIAREILEIPLERIVLETDAPYLAPTPLRGTVNESSNIPLIALALAQIKGTTLQNVAQVTTQNAKQLFGILS